MHRRQQCVENGSLSPTASSQSWDEEPLVVCAAATCIVPPVCRCSALVQHQRTQVLHEGRHIRLPVKRCTLAMLLCTQCYLSTDLVIHSVQCKHAAGGERNVMGISKKGNKDTQWQNFTTQSKDCRPLDEGMRPAQSRKPQHKQSRSLTYVQEGGLYRRAKGALLQHGQLGIGSRYTRRLHNMSPLGGAPSRLCGEACATVIAWNETGWGRRPDCAQCPRAASRRPRSLPLRP